MNPPDYSENNILEPAQLLQLVLDTIPQKVFWKDLNSVYLGCNRLFAKDAGLKSPEDIVGQTDFDLPWKKEEAEFYRLCDRRVMDRNQAEIGIVESQRNSNGDSTYLETNKVPLCNESGEVIGILGSYHDITKIKEAENTLREAHDLLEQRVKDRTQELRFLAEHDPLTSLANRDYFTAQLNEVIKECTPFGILFIDVDRFKSINDTLGHDVGDKFLVQIAQSLTSCVRAHDTVSRFGGDEFTVLLRNIRTEAEVCEICNRIQGGLADSVQIEHFPFVVSASIGMIADLNGQYGSANDILRNSDIAMYEAKRSGRGCHRVFSEEMLKSVQERHELEQRIRLGITQKQFFNVYQPIVGLDAGGLCGFEALLRWSDQTETVISPGEFLPLAEETGLIVEIGEQIILQACSQLCDWLQEYPSLKDLSVSVNLSIKQLMLDDFILFLETALAKYGLEPQHINIEITESMMLDKHSSAKRVLELLSARGHKIMLDDFGTGYSSLSYLHDFPIDTLKIDQSFIRGIATDHNSQAIVKTVLGLAQLLEMDAIAEGVETVEEESYLRDLGCSKVQGYLYAKPLNGPDADDFIKRCLAESDTKQTVVRRN